ncbi:MAG: hypothetical protein IKO32_03820 [Lachnospiraceae bacterium]|nr:hypothetical protein [Lachnospiraceae bacterium]
MKVKKGLVYVAFGLALAVLLVFGKGFATVATASGNNSGSGVNSGNNSQPTPQQPTYPEKTTPPSGWSNIPFVKAAPAPETVTPDPNVTLSLQNDGVFHYYYQGKPNTTTYAFVPYGGGKFLVANGTVAKIDGLAQDPSNPDTWYFCSQGQVQIVTQLALYDGCFFNVANGKLDTKYTGFVQYDGSYFIVSNGKIRTDINGLIEDPNAPQNWYYVAEGKLQNQYTGLALYDGSWFYVVNGKLASYFTSKVTYDGSQFQVVDGYVKK